MQKSASVLRKWIESQDPFRLYPSAFNPKDYRIPMETGVSRKIIFRVWASGTTALTSLLLTLHRVMNIQYYDLRSNQLQLKDEQKEWDARKKFEKKKPVKRQSWSTVQWHASTRPSAAGHGSKEWICYSWPSLVRVFMTSCFLHEKESPCCLCPLPIASHWSVTVSALCRRVPN